MQRPRNRASPDPGQAWTEVVVRMALARLNRAATARVNDPMAAVGSRSNAVAPIVAVAVRDLAFLRAVLEASREDAP